MTIQQAMIERLRQTCQQDERIVGAMLYGSFTRSEGDRFSDIECVLFFQDDLLHEIDQRAWVSQLARVEMYFHNEWGIGTAIFDNLVRGEFHFDPASQMNQVETWGEADRFPSLDATLLVDRTGELARRLQALIGPPPSPDTPERAQQLIKGFVNWLLFGSNVLTRGESARALELLWWSQRHLLTMVRLIESSTEHLVNPTKALEKDISAPAYARYVACTSNLDKRNLDRAFLAAWTWGKEMMPTLLERHELAFPGSLIDRLDSLFQERHS